MKKILLPFLALIILSLSSSINAKSIRIGTEGAYPPWNNLNSAGELEGAEIDFGNEACKRMGVDCEWVTQDWDGIIPALLNGKYDIRDILLFNFIYLGGVFLDSSFYCSYHDNWYSVSLFILVYLLFLSGLYYFSKKKKKEYENKMLKSIINKIVFLYTVVNVFVLLQYKC